MPAVVRGAGRGSAKARSKSSASPGKSRAASAKAAAATPPRIQLSPRLIAAGAGVAVIGVVGIVLASDHRGEHLAQAAADGFLAQTAAAGLRLQNVRLEGASPSPAPISSMRRPGKGTPLLGLDLDGARRRIEQVGWVKTAHVERLFPDSVVISVDERKLLAVWQHDGRAGVIGRQRVVAPEADPGKFASLPLVVGAGANTAAQGILGPVMSRQRLAERLDALVRVDEAALGPAAEGRHDRPASGERRRGGADAAGPARSAVAHSGFRLLTDRSQ